jgi:NADP-dependent 3-hydroxy acid dehydrogenase YdfG
MTTWLITGASSGLGQALAQAVLEKGDNAVVTARDAKSVGEFALAYPDSALPVALDVTDHALVEAAVAQATERFGAVDVLVNNAGHGFRAAVEEAAVDETAELFATNFFGPVDLIKSVLPQMRSRRSGTISTSRPSGLHDRTRRRATTRPPRPPWKRCPTG